MKTKIITCLLVTAAMLHSTVEYSQAQSTLGQIAYKADVTAIGLNHAVNDVSNLGNNINQVKSMGEKFFGNKNKDKKEPPADDKNLKGISPSPAATGTNHTMINADNIDYGKLDEISNTLYKDGNVKNVTLAFTGSAGTLTVSHDDNLNDMLKVFKVNYNGVYEITGMGVDFINIRLK